ncbi:TPA: hypothetical protein QCJ34_003808 [Enterobacter ludwigii]|nr:hypothetical protein [Enterobacter ludwigii]
MGKKLNVAEGSCRESTITIITQDKYFFLALKYLINSMLPEILNEKGILYNVGHCESVFHMNYQNELQCPERLLIADYDVRLIGNSHVLKLIQGMKIFRSIMLVIHKELPLAGVDGCLSKGLSVDEIKTLSGTLFCERQYQKIWIATICCRVLHLANTRSFE